MSSSGTDTLLYELICCSEWTEEKEELVPFQFISTCKTGLLFYVNPTKLFRNKPLTPVETAVWLKSVGPTWNYSVTSDGKIIAILQESHLETRSSKDNFSGVLGRTKITKDEFPNFRRMTWSKDSSLLAIAFTNGVITCFDIMSSQLFSVQRQDPISALIDKSTKSLSFSVDLALTGMFFAEERLKNTLYCSELITVDRFGIVKAFRQSNPDEIQFHHEASFRQYYPFGVTDVQYADFNGLILVAGNLLQDLHEKNDSSGFGITGWRLLLDYPYYRILYSIERHDFRMDVKRLWKFATHLALSKAPHQEPVLKMCLSPDGNNLGVIHVSGRISILRIPSLRLRFSWPLTMQFQYNASNSRFNYGWRKFFNMSQGQTMDPIMYHPYDLNWWDNESIIIARANGTVTVIPLSENQENMLGELPEVFESPVRVSPRFGKIFFALESEVRIKGNSDENSEKRSIGLVPFTWIKSGIQEILFWLTDIDAFRPPRKRKRKLPCWLHTNRLFTLHNITPQELFFRKIEHEEYGEALDLAKFYSLDQDLVFQRQWTRAPVSIHTIKDFLAKITKRNWVLQECLDRVPDTIDAARELLKFGLRGTDVTVAVLISQGKDKGKFILWSPDDLELAKEEYLSLVDSKNEEVIRLLRYRKRFLYFVDVLDTYEKMLGGPRTAEERYNSNIYGKLRSQELVDSAIEMARTGDVDALRLLVTYHWDSISPYYLDIISNFPETWSPYNYKDFLPGIYHDDKLILWDDIVSKDSDWCDDILLKTNSPSKRKSSVTKVIGRNEVVKWYETRILQIEGHSSITSHALDLGLLGLERNFTELQNLVQDLQTLENLIYEVQIEDMTLGKFNGLSDIQKITLLLSKSTDESLVSDFRFYVNPFLNAVENRQGSNFQLLNDFLVEMSSNNLGLVKMLFEASRQDEVDPLITDPKDILQLAYNCIYSCKSSDQIENIQAILDCVPERNYTQKKLVAFYALIDETQDHLNAMIRLKKYHVSFTMDKIRQISREEDEASITEFLGDICKSASKVHPPLKLNDWKALLYDLLEIRKKLFKNFSIETTFEIYVSSLLKSGHHSVIQLAEDFLEKTPDISSNGQPEYSTGFSLYLHVISYEKSLSMILESAQMYLDSSSSYADPDIELCKTCLNLIHNTKESRIIEMFDLLDAVKLINKDFRLHILPYSIRICQDKVELIRQAIDKCKDGYKKIQQLLKLVIVLHIEGLTMEAGESMVLEMAGNAALDANDLNQAMEICQNIKAKNYKSGWKIFADLAKDQTYPPIMSSSARASYINYALAICPNSEILEVLNTKNLIEVRNLQSRLMELSPNVSGADESLLENQKDESIRKGRLDAKQFQEFLKTTTKWIIPLKEMADAVKSGSSNFLSQKINRAEKNTKITNESEKNRKTNADFDFEGCPTFELTENDSNKFFHESTLSYDYKSFANSSSLLYNASNPSLEHCLILNRMWHLEKMLLSDGKVPFQDDQVYERLVLEILPEDIPWGLAILFSIEKERWETCLPSIFSNLPKTPVSILVCLYFLGLRIQMEVLELSAVTDDNLHLRNPNKVIAQTSELLKDGTPESEGDIKKLTLLCKLFRELEEELDFFKS